MALWADQAEDIIGVTANNPCLDCKYPRMDGSYRERERFSTDEKWVIFASFWSLYKIHKPANISI